MEYYAGIDVSLKDSSVCILDLNGKIFLEAKVPSEQDLLTEWFTSTGLSFARIGMEAGPLSQWLHAGLSGAGLPIDLLETRGVKAALAAMPVKTDRNDARGIAQLVRTGWFRPVHCKSISAQEKRSLLQTRSCIQKKLLDIKGHMRGELRGYGLKVGKVSPGGFPGRIRELVADHPTLQSIAESLLKVQEILESELRKLDKRVLDMARDDENARLLMTTPGVGPIVALTFTAAIDDPSRFKSSKDVGPHFGLTPKKYQSGETDYNGRITKKGDRSVRCALFEAANVILTRPLQGCTELKSWAMKIGKRAGMTKAKVALARKLAVILHRMLVNRTPFKSAAADAAKTAAALTGAAAAKSAVETAVAATSAAAEAARTADAAKPGTAAAKSAVKTAVAARSAAAEAVRTADAAKTGTAAAKSAVKTAGAARSAEAEAVRTADAAKPGTAAAKSAVETAGAARSAAAEAARTADAAKTGAAVVKSAVKTAGVARSAAAEAARTAAAKSA